MKTFVKILLVIVAIVGIAGASFWGGTQFGQRQAIAAASGAPQGIPPLAGPRGNWTPDGNRGDFNWDRMDNRSWQHPMMQNNFPGGTRSGMMDRSMGGFSGMFPFGGFLGGGLMLIGLLFPLGILTLIILGIIVLFRMVRKPAVISAEVVDVPPTENS